MKLLMKLRAFYSGAPTLRFLGLLASETELLVYKSVSWRPLLWWHTVTSQVPSHPSCQQALGEALRADRS